MKKVTGYLVKGGEIFIHGDLVFKNVKINAPKHCQLNWGFDNLKPLGVVDKFEGDDKGNWVITAILNELGIEFINKFSNTVNFAPGGVIKKRRGVNMEEIDEFDIKEISIVKSGANPNTGIIKLEE